MCLPGIDQSRCFTKNIWYPWLRDGLGVSRSGQELPFRDRGSCAPLQLEASCRPQITTELVVSLQCLALAPPAIPHEQADDHPLDSLPMGVKCNPYHHVCWSSRREGAQQYFDPNSPCYQATLNRRLASALRLTSQASRLLF